MQARANQQLGRHRRLGGRTDPAGFLLRGKIGRDGLDVNLRPPAGIA
jgi:hypothetical protein